MNTLTAFACVAVGGAIGSVARAAIALVIPTRFPWAILLINVAGSFLIGWLMAHLGPYEPDHAARWRAVLVTGFCGGFTTFSTFSWQTLEHALKGEWGIAIANVLLSVTLCLLGVWLGYRLGHA